MIRNQDLGSEAADAKHRDVEQHRAADDQPQCVAHRGDVGGDVERIGNEQEPTKACSSVAGIALPRLAASPFPVTAPMRALTN